MIAHLIKRIGLALVMLYSVLTTVFLLLYLVPGDPAELLLSAGGMTPSADMVQSLREQMGLNRPLGEQYVDYLKRVVHGDLGVSLTDGSPVADNINERLPKTLELIGLATLLALAAGVPMGVAAARRQGAATDRSLAVLSGVALSVPTFVLGSCLELVFAQMLHLVPAGGEVPIAVSPGRHFLTALMPALTIATGFTAVVFRMTRSTVLGVLREDWVRTARAKGLSERQVVKRHVVRNSLGPVVTVAGLQIGTLLGGTVLVEYVFNWPGLSSFLITAVEQRDYPEVQGVVLVVAALFILLNLVVDIVNSLLDPRVRKS